jgi:nitrate reductase molybdenum cofactor assembly chaperone
VEGGPAAAPGVPHAADGLVRAAAVADQLAANAGHVGVNGEIPDVKDSAHPGAVPGQPAHRGRHGKPVERALERMLAMRAYQRGKHVDKVENLAVLQQVGLSQAEVEEMYQIMAIANYEDRFVIPTHAPRVRREHLRRARRLRLLVRQRLLRRRHRDQPVRRQEATHDPDQGHRLKETATMLTRKTPKAARHSLRALAALLRYPDATLRAALPEVMRGCCAMKQALAEPRLDEIEALACRLAGADPLRDRAAYVETFDRGRRTSLHLFEHVHGDSRDRGPAMIDLMQTYEKAGLFLGDELPDFLPVVLEFASTQPPAVAREFLGEMAHILNAVFSALRERESPYASRARPRCSSSPAKRRGSADRGRPRRSTTPGPSRPPSTAAAPRARPGPASRSPSTSFAKPPSSTRESPHERPQHLPVRHLSLHLPHGVLAGSLMRFDRDQYTWKSDSSQLLRKGQLRWGSNLFHVGVLFLFFGHFVGMLTPHFVYEAFITAGQKQVLAMVRAASPACWLSSA